MKEAKIIFVLSHTYMKEAKIIIIKRKYREHKKTK